MNAPGYPPGFFDRADESADSVFYAPPRLVTHIDDAAIAAVGRLYTELGLHGRLLDLMSSWVSHLEARPEHLTVLGMNQAELDANPMADATTVHDLNVDPSLPYDDHRFDAAMCCVSVDYLSRPVEVFTELARVLVPGGVFVCTFSNRLFPTKAVRGWLHADDAQRCEIVAGYFADSGAWAPATTSVRIAPGGPTDPLYAVWSTTVQPG